MEFETLHILISSHACSLPQNQQLFALAARSRGWRVTMVLPSHWKNEYGKYNEARLLEGFEAELVQAPVLKNGSVPLHVYWLNATKLLRSRRPDIVYSHNEGYALSTMQWCRANAKSGKRPFGFFSCQNLMKRYPFPFRQGESWVYRNSKFFFPITSSVEKVHREKGYKGAATIVPLGFDPEVYSTDIDVEPRHVNSKGTFRLAFVGRVVEEKGLVTLAAAMGLVRDLDFKLVIVGAGPFENQVRSAFKSANVEERVEWRGFVPHDQVAKFYSSADALILPSESRPNWTEQFGRVLLEALACGTPVIGSDSGEIPTIIRETGGGLIFEEANPSSCADALRRMITDTDRRASMAKTGHAYVHQNYGLPALANRFADTIEAVLNATI